MRFKNDLDTFCKYIALRPPNLDHTVHEHREDRLLEGSIRGIYYVARYRRQPAEDGPAARDDHCRRPTSQE